MFNRIKDYFQSQLEKSCPVITVMRIHKICQRNVSELQSKLAFDLSSEERRQYYNYHLRTEICKYVIAGFAAYMFRDVFAAVFESLNFPQYLGSICEYIDEVTIDRVLIELLAF